MNKNIGMSLKKYWYDKGMEMCYTCKFIDEYAFNVRGEGKIPHGYDGSAECGAFNEDEEESTDNRWMISPCWSACKKYERCTEAQAEYREIYDIETHSIIPNPNDISKIGEL